MALQHPGAAIPTLADGVAGTQSPDIAYSSEESVGPIHGDGMGGPVGE